MKSYASEDIRNVALVGHSDTGKTTLVSRLLFDAGTRTRPGSVEDGTTVTDFEEDEISIKHSIATAVAHCDWDGKKINLIDTPGYGVFLTESKSAMRVSDAAAIVVNGVKGVEVNTEKVWKFAADLELPVMFVGSKMDRERANAPALLQSLRDKFGKGVIPVQMPIGSEHDFEGVIDLITLEAWTWKDGEATAKREKASDELKEAAAGWREELIEKVAENDDELMERYFEEGTLSKDDLLTGLRKEFLAREIQPLVFVAPGSGVGGQAFLEMIASIVPNPLEAEIRGVAEGSAEASRDGQPVALLFKTISDPFSGRISLFRVYSGSLRSDSVYHNISRDHEERFGKLQVMQGKEADHVGEIVAGDIGAVAKLKDSHTGDTIGVKDGPKLDFVDIPEASIAFAIEPKSKGDDDKLSNAIHRILEEDPSLAFSRDEETGEFLLSGQGQLHVETAVNRLKTKYGVDVILHPPKVPYRETITARVEAHGRHKKQSGGHGQFADCKIVLEPLQRGEEFEFVNEVFGGSIPRQFIPAVEKGVQEARLKGYLAGFPVVDFRVRLTDGQFHAVDSSEMAFKIAGAIAFRDGMSRAKATIIEPIMKIDITAPSEYIGDLVGDLTSRRGRMDGMDTDGEVQVIRAHVPMAEVLSYGPTLRSITQGRGSFHVELSHYEEVPRNVQKKIIEESPATTETSH